MCGRVRGQPRLVPLTQVVEATLSEDLGAGLEPDGLGVGGLVQLGDDAAQRSEEGPARMDDLHLAVPLEGLGVGGQTGGILREGSGRSA